VVAVEGVGGSRPKVLRPPQVRACGVPVVHRKGISGAARNLKGLKPTAWDSELWNIAGWYREG
jgi:hypothetical protein